MENNSTSGLKIKQVIATILILIILSANIQLFSFIQEKTQVAEIKEIEQVKVLENNTEEVQVADVATVTSKERTSEVTARSAEERTLENKQEEKYITIEEITISRDMDLSKRCGISKEDFKTLMQNLKADRSGFFYENSDAIYDLCEKYEINEVFFCGLIAAESGWSISSNHRNKNNYISMMSKGKLIRYSTPEEGLEAAAKLLHNKYLTPGGSCYYGKTLSSVQKRFCPNSSTWVNLVYGCMKTIV